MHDTLGYFERDLVHRPWHQDQITFASTYREQENCARRYRMMRWCTKALIARPPAR